MKVKANGIAIHVEEQGQGVLSLVFLHYWGGSCRTWKHVQDALKPSFHTLTLDHRGWGDSDAPTDGYGLADLAADAEGVIAALCPGPYVLIGHSMGGKVAQLMASRRLPALIGLVLVAPSPPSPMNLPAEAREMMATAYVSRESVAATIDHMLTAKQLSAEDREQVIADSLRGAPAAKLAWPKTTSLEDISRQVSAIDVPTLVIAGELDRVDPPEVLREELLSRIPQAIMEVLPGTGHLSMLESPDALVNLIARFCRALPGRTF